MSGTLEHWNVSLAALAAVRLDLFHTTDTLLVTCHDAKNGRPNPFDHYTLTYFETVVQSLLKKTGIKYLRDLPSFFSII